MTTPNVPARVPNAVTPTDPTEEPKGLERFRQYGELNEAARRDVQRARNIREVSELIGATEWGANLNTTARVALARWCIARDVDPVIELDNVGGPYINSEYWLRKLGELRVRGVVRDVEQQHIAADVRLVRTMNDEKAPADVREWAAREHYTRMKLRMQFGVPEEATGACVTRIFLARGGEPICGVKWGGGGTSVKQPRHGGGSAPNPVVEGNAVLSVESQSIRRAMRQLAIAVPDSVPDIAGIDTELREIRQEIGPMKEPAPAPGRATITDSAYGATEEGPALVAQTAEPVTVDDERVREPAALPDDEATLRAEEQEMLALEEKGRARP